MPVSLRLILACFACSTIVSNVQAIAPSVETPGPDEIIADRGIEQGGAILLRASGSESLKNRMLFENIPAGWRVQLKTRSSRLHRAFGQGIPVGNGSMSIDQAHQGALRFLEDYSGVVGAPIETLRLERILEGPRHIAIHFAQHYDEMPIIGARLIVLFTRTGQVTLVETNVYEEVHAAHTPAISPERAIHLAVERGGIPDEEDSVANQGLMILPHVTEAGEVIYTPVYAVNVFKGSSRDPYEVMVDAVDGSISHRMRLVWNLDISGSTTGDLEPDGYCDGVVSGALIPGARVEVPGVGMAFSDQAGDFEIPYSGIDMRSFTATLSGEFIAIQNASGANAAVQGSIIPGVSKTIEFVDANSKAAERDVFSYLNEHHEWIRELDPNFDALDALHTAEVDISPASMGCPGNAQ